MFGEMKLSAIYNSNLIEFNYFKPLHHMQNDLKEISKLLFPLASELQDLIRNLRELNGNLNRINSDLENFNFNPKADE